MMKATRKIAVVGTALALTFTLAACGGGNEDAGNAGSEQPTVEVTQAAPQEEVPAPGSLRAKTADELAQVIGTACERGEYALLAAYMSPEALSSLRKESGAVDFSDVHGMVQRVWLSEYGTEWELLEGDPEWSYRLTRSGPDGVDGPAGALFESAAGGTEIHFDGSDAEGWTIDDYTWD